LKRLESKPAPTGSQIAQELLSRGLTSTRLHRTTVHRAAKKLAQAQGSPIHAVRGKPGKQITPATKHKRLCFAKANQSRNWGTVMFTDRKKFLFTYPGFKISPVTWVRKGMRREASAVNHPMALNVYTGITKYGVTACHVVAGTSKQISRFKNKKDLAAHNITSQEYMAVMKTLCFLRMPSCSNITGYHVGSFSKTMTQHTRMRLVCWKGGTGAEIAALLCWRTGLQTALI